MDRGTWQATVHGGQEESDMTEHSCKVRKGRIDRELKAGKVKPYPHITQLVGGTPGLKCREFNSRGLFSPLPHQVHEEGDRTCFVHLYTLVSDRSQAYRGGSIVFVK